MRTYRGRNGHEVAWRAADSERWRLLGRRLDLRNHSPDGFSWGYEGSGPAQLALALLAHVTGDDRRSLASYQQFKRRVIGRLDMNAGWQMSSDAVLLELLGIEKERELKACAEPADVGELEVPDHHVAGEFKSERVDLLGAGADDEPDDPNETET